MEHTVIAANSPMFWAVVGILALVIVALALRDFVLWYFRINDIVNLLKQIAGQEVNRCTCTASPKAEHATADEKPVIAAIVAAYHASRS